MEVLISPTGTQVMMSNVSGVMRDEITTGPLFYDYSEQFDREQFMEPEADAVPTGFVHRIKTILEERGTPDQLPKKVDASVVQEVDEHTREVIVVAELPASPVPRRITRELILAALEPASTTDGVEMSESSSEGKKAGVPFCQENEEHVRSGQRQEEPANSMQLEEKKKHRSGVLSQAKSSVMDSSTQDLAVRYSVPMATASGNEPAVGSSTEDGMSDLLDGYQHTEMKQDHYAVAETESSMGEPNERHSSHTQRSSSQQSFKSCTDLPKKAYKDSDAKSAKSCTDLPELLEQPRKDSDGRSFKTCKDTVTPERAVSMPPLGVPSSGLASVETIIRRPVSEMPTSSTPLMVQKQPPIFPRESNFSMTSVKLRSGDSKPSVRHGSTVTSISSSVDSVIQKPPSVPPRDSSSSKEAQRTQAVADFLVRLSRPRRFSKAQSGFGKKQAKEQAKEEATAELESSEDVQKLDPPKDPQNAATGKPSTQLPSDLIRTSEKALPREKIISKKQVPTRLSSKHCASTKDSTSAQKLDSPITPLMHQHSLSTPSPVIAEPSSVYSPDDVASPRSRVQSSPMPFVKSPENGRRYSQTTTHLVWHGRNTSNLPSVNTAESRPTQGNGQDETTTDLRLSAYRYPLHYLPDLKEESHEDSSLNTSASNLKNSNFRFPFGRQPSLRASVDETAMLGRNPSTRSFHRKSSQLGHTRGLPSMNFSRMDLIGKLNEALDIHSSGLLGGMPDDVDFQELTQSGLLRPASAREIREKYRSFFASLDELEKTGDPTQAATTIMDLMPLKRPYSSEKLMEEIDKLTIPSVGGLTQRLSEFIPSLKEYYKLGEVGEFIAEQVIMEHAMEELNEVGGPAPKRSSARLRPMPGSPNMVVIDDTLYKELTDKDLKDIPRAGDDSADETEEDASDCGVVQRRGGYDTRARDRTPLAELEAPSPAFLRTRSHSLGHHDLRPSLEFRLSSRRSLRSFVTSTPTDTRPWNNIENYAFLATSVDISLPTPAGNMKFGQAPSPLRNQVARRDSAEYHGEEGPASLHNTTNNSPGSPSILANVSSLDDQIQPARRLSRFGMFSSSKHECFDASGNATGPLRLRGSDQSHAAGERYPFSALTPPTNLHMPGEDMSVDTGSEASEGEGHGTTVKKDRFTLRKGTGRKKATQAGHYTGSAPEYMQDREGEARDFSLARRNTFAGAERMPKRKYCVDRFINRIKIMWHKSGDFVRSLSKRNSNGNGNGNGAVQSQDEELSPFPKNVEENFVINKNGKKIYIPKGLEGSRGTEVYTGV